MTGESIFNFLTEDKIFKDVYKTCLELEKAIANDMIDSAFNRSRVAIEELLEIIIKKDKQDKKLSKEVYSNYTSLSEILYRCNLKKYIDVKFYHKLNKFVKNFGNVASHRNNENFTINDTKNAHRLIFDFSVDVFKRFDSRFDKEYVFDLSYLNDDKNFTKSEVDDIIQTIHINDVSTDVIIDEIEDKELFLTKKQFETLIKPITNDISYLSDIEFITPDNLDSILTNYDDSIKQEILSAVEKSQKDQLNDISQTIKDLEQSQISISQINDLINKNNDELLILIKEVAGELIKSQLENIIGEFKSTPIIEGNTIIEAPNYEVVETEDSFEIKEIEKILGIQDKCPKCNTVLKKGSTKCHNCDYDFFKIINKRCPECGKRVPIGSKFCIRCGNNLEVNICSKCGFENEVNSKFCIKCGNDLNG